MPQSYRIIAEEGPHNWSAYSPDVPGCIATGRTKADVERNFRSAVAFHREGLAGERAERGTAPRAGNKGVKAAKTKAPARSGK